MFEIEDSKPTNCVVAKRSSLVGIGIVGEERKEGNECSVRNDVARNGKINIEAEEAPVSFVKPFRTALRFLQNTHRRVKEKAERIDAILTRATASYRAVIRGYEAIPGDVYEDPEAVNAEVQRIIDEGEAKDGVYSDTTSDDDGDDDSTDLRENGFYGIEDRAIGPIPSNGIVDVRSVLPGKTYRVQPNEVPGTLLDLSERVNSSLPRAGLGYYVERDAPTIVRKRPRY